MANSVIHLTIRKSLKEKLDQMAARDRRDKTDFLRLLIEDEWKRRTSADDGEAATEGNGARS